MSEVSKTWKIIIMAISAPPLLLMIIAVILGDEITGQSFKRFANALITGYTFSTGLATIFGSLITLWLLSQGDLLLEENGSVRAQALSNIVRILVSLVALIMAVAVAVGGTFVAITSRPKRRLFEEE
jgi:hypothetical protein